MQEATAAIDHLPSRIGGYYARNPLPGRLHGLAAWSPLQFAHVPHQITLQPGIFVKRISQIIARDDFAVANVHLSHGQLMNRRQLRLIGQSSPAPSHNHRRLQHGRAAIASWISGCRRT